MCECDFAHIEVALDADQFNLAKTQIGELKTLLGELVVLSQSLGELSVNIGAAGTNADSVSRALNGAYSGLNSLVGISNAGADVMNRLQEAIDATASSNSGAIANATSAATNATSNMTGIARAGQVGMAALGGPVGLAVAGFGALSLVYGEVQRRAEAASIAFNSNASELSKLIPEVDKAVTAFDSLDEAEQRMSAARSLAVLANLGNEIGFELSGIRGDTDEYANLWERMTDDLHVKLSPFAAIVSAISDATSTTEFESFRTELSAFIGDVNSLSSSIASAQTMDQFYAIRDQEFARIDSISDQILELMKQGEIDEAEAVQALVRLENIKNSIHEVGRAKAVQIAEGMSDQARQAAILEEQATALEGALDGISTDGFDLTDPETILRIADAMSEVRAHAEHLEALDLESQLNIVESIGEWMLQAELGTDEVANLVREKLQTLVEEMHDKGLEFVQNFVAGLIENKPILYEEVELILDLLEVIFEGVSASWPYVLGLNLLENYIQGISEKIPSLSTELAPVTDVILGVFEDLASSQYSSGEQAVQNFASGMNNALEGTADQVSAFNGINAKMYSGGREMVNQLGMGIVSNKEHLQNAMEEITTGVIRFIPQSPAKEGPLRGLTHGGQEIVQQLADGMASNNAARLAAAGIAADVADELTVDQAMELQIASENASDNQSLTDRLKAGWDWLRANEESLKAIGDVIDAWGRLGEGSGLGEGLASALVGNLAEGDLAAMQGTIAEFKDGNLWEGAKTFWKEFSEGGTLSFKEMMAKGERFTDALKAGLAEFEAKFGSISGIIDAAKGFFKGLKSEEMFYEDATPENLLGNAANLVKNPYDIASWIGLAKGFIGGTKVTGTGVSGVITGSGAKAMDSTEKTTKRLWGLYKKRRTTYKHNASLSDLLSGGAAELRDRVQDMASSLGFDALKLSGVKHAFNFSTKGLSQKQIQKKIEAELTKYGSKLAGKVSGLNAYVEDGETKLAALTRLSSALTTVNTMFEGLGHTLFDTSLAGADAASELVEVFGGLDEFSSATSTYFDKFYSDQEKFQFSSAQLAKQLEELGINVVPTSAEAFRALVDHAAEAGDHELYAGLVGLAGDMDSVLTQADQLKDAMGGVEKSFTSLAEERLAKALLAAPSPEPANDEGAGGVELSTVQLHEISDRLAELVSLTKETRDDQAREAA